MKARLTVLFLLPLLTLLFITCSCMPGESLFLGKAKIYVEEDGIYRLTYADLREAGLNLKGIEPAAIRLSNRGREIPIRIAGRGESLTIEFYGVANDSRYGVANVYWLTVNQGVGRRMAERTASAGDVVSFPASFTTALHREEDLIYWPKAPEGADHWYWQSLTAPASATFSFVLSHLADGDSVLRVSLLGGTSAAVEPDHHLRLSINGHLIADVTWDGQKGHVVEKAVPHSYLLEGENTLALDAPGDTGAKADIALLDWFELDYQRRFLAEDDRLNFEGRCPELDFGELSRAVEGQADAYQISGFSQRDVDIFDITDPDNVAHLSGHTVERKDGAYAVSFSDSGSGRRRYLAVSSKGVKKPVRIAPAGPADLRAPGNQADYIVIAHPDFLRSLQPLVEWRRSQGLEVVLATIEEVYDEFSYGLTDPTAIRDFLRYAHQHWDEPAPRYVLLVGDASYDYRDNLGAPNKNRVPTYLLETHFVGETASDNWFVLLDDDALPDMAIGRLPVKSVAGVEIVVDKIMSYESKSVPGEWLKRILFVADDDEPVFEAISNDVIKSYLPPDYQAVKVYLSAFAGPEGSAARIIEEINEGSLIVSYIGHAALDVWAKERMFSSADIASLRNGDRLPFVVTMTCLDGYFHHPEADCLAEELLLAEDKGAIACFAPTSESLPSDQDILVKALFEALFGGDAPTMGEAIMRAKRSLPHGGHGYEDLIGTYTFFGDPALGLKWPP